jgi:hypothetical protein
MSVQFKNFPTPLEECIRRDALRTGRAKVGRIVIERMALTNGLIKWSDTPVVFTDQEGRVHTSKKNIVIVDVDGTLADNKHRIRHKTVVCKSCKNGRVEEYDGWHGEWADFLCQDCHGTGSVQGGMDWNHYYQEHLILSDETKPVIVDWVRELYKTHTVVILSGRPENRAGKATEEWLQINDIPYHHFFMRGSGDMRDDVLVKKDILDKLPKNKIAFCIDDRGRICRMWRENGLTCYQVVPPEEGEF